MPFHLPFKKKIKNKKNNNMQTRSINSNVTNVWESCAKKAVVSLVKLIQKDPAGMLFKSKIVFIVAD